MAFVYEYVTSEEYKEWIAPFNFKKPLGNYPLQFSKWLRWTIDRERNIFFIGLGREGAIDTGIPSFAALVIDGEVVNIEYRSGGTGSYTEGLKWWQIIESVSIPKNLLATSTREEIEQLIVEIFIQQAYGSENSHKVITVDIIFEYQGLKYNLYELLSVVETWKQKNHEYITSSIEKNQNRIVEITSSTMNSDIDFKVMLYYG